MYDVRERDCAHGEERHWCMMCEKETVRVERSSFRPVPAWGSHFICTALGGQPGCAEQRCCAGGLRVFWAKPSHALFDFRRASRAPVRRRLVCLLAGDSSAAHDTYPHVLRRGQVDGVAWRLCSWVSARTTVGGFSVSCRQSAKNTSARHAICWPRSCVTLEARHVPGGHWSTDVEPEINGAEAMPGVVSWSRSRASSCSSRVPSAQLTAGSSGRHFAGQ